MHVQGSTRAVRTGGGVDLLLRHAKQYEDTQCGRIGWGAVRGLPSPRTPCCPPFIEGRVGPTSISLIQLHAGPVGFMWGRPPRVHFE